MKKISFTNVLKAKEISLEKLHEASLGRAYQLYQNTKNKSFGIITAFRKGNKPEINNKNNEKLEHIIRSWGYGFIVLKGYGNERDKEGNVKQVIEWSFWVNGITKEQIIKAGKKFEQDFVLYAGPDTGGKVTGIDLGDEIETDLGEFHPMKIGQFYSKIKGKPFVFEYVVQSWGEGMLKMIWEKKN